SQCTSLQLCFRCGQHHPLKEGCSNEIKCVNCQEHHYSGHSPCPVVQQKRKQLSEQIQKNNYSLINAHNHHHAVKRYTTYYIHTDRQSFKHFDTKDNDQQLIWHKLYRPLIIIRNKMNQLNMYKCNELQQQLKNGAVGLNETTIRAGYQIIEDWCWTYSRTEYLINGRNNIRNQIKPTTT
ncbi:unnamed protein product, partial [Rotaria magnacalcarata]